MKQIFIKLRQLLALLSDINNELQMIRKATEDWATETRLLRELIANATAVPDKGHDYPEGFPHIDRLVEAGFTSPSQLPRTASGLRRMGLDDTAVYDVLRAISQAKPPVSTGTLKQGVKS